MNRYTVRFTAVRATAKNFQTAKLVRRVFRVVARDTYEALDILNDKHNLRELFALRRFEFGVAKPIISKKTLSRALSATPEQEEQSTDAAVPASKKSK